MSSAGKRPHQRSSDACSADSKRNGLEMKDKQTTATVPPMITDPRVIKSSSSSSAFEEDFPFFYNMSPYPDAHIWSASKQSPGSYNDATDERDPKEGDMRSSSALHSSDSGRGSSDDGAPKKQTCLHHPQSSFPSRAQDSETTVPKEPSRFVSSNLLSSFKQPKPIESKRDDNYDMLGKNTTRQSGRQTASKINMTHENPKKVLWKSLENDRQQVKELTTTSTPDDERFCRNHPQLLVDCNAFPIENNCGSFV